MCGIFGVFGKHERLPSRNNIESALGTLSHRGPDANGLAWRPEIGLALGHTRLSIIDPEPRSNQPFVTTWCTMVFNGEIYNYRELRKQLLAVGAAFQTEGDTEVIVQGYKYWGVQVFGRLRGMYAIVLYDEVEKCLYIARDEFGIKPLCYLERSGVVAIASEVKALASLYSLSVNEDVLTDFLSWGFQMENSSLYDGVRFLPPGAVHKYSLTGNSVLHVKEDSSWDTKYAYLDPDDEISSEKLRETIRQSVDDHLISDVPVALTLSGGLDSSIVASLAAESHSSLCAYTFTLAKETDPEVEHASLLCRHLGMEHRIVRLTAGNTQSWLRQVARHLEEPVANINALPNYALAAFVRKQGHKVVLVGEGADELFAGYPWYRYALDPNMSKEPMQIFDAYRRRRSQSGINSLLRPDSSKAAADRYERQKMAFGVRLSEIPGSPLDGFLSFDQSTQLQYSQLLRIDRMFMAHGVEARVPFLYRSVLEASSTISSSRKMPQIGSGLREEKYALAEAFSKQLPQEISSRPKFGEQGTVNVWNSLFADSLESEFKRCLHSDELRGSRQMLDQYIDWKKVEGATLSAKEKFTLSLTLESVDALLLSRHLDDDDLPVHCEITN